MHELSYQLSFQTHLWNQEYSSLWATGSVLARVSKIPSIISRTWMTPHFVTIQGKQKQHAAPEKSWRDLLASSPASNQEMQEGKQVWQKKTGNFWEQKRYRELWGCIISCNTSPCTGSTNKAIKDTEHLHKLPGYAGHDAHKLTCGVNTSVQENPLRFRMLLWDWWNSRGNPSKSRRVWEVFCPLCTSTPIINANYTWSNFSLESISIFILESIVYQ